MLAEWQIWAHDGARITPEGCARIIEQGLRFPVQDGTAGGRVDHSVRSSDIRWIARRDPEFAWLYELVTDRAGEANRNAFGFDFNYLPEMQFTEYREGRKGHYNWHQDVFFTGDPDPKCAHRKLSVVLQLSDPETYEGGDLELDVQSPPLRSDLRKQGSMIFFPSFIHHRVTPLTKGKRNSVVAWFEGPKWR